VARKGIPYGRFSGKRQEAGDSTRRQDELAAAAAAAEGVELDLSYNLNDRGMSAFRGRNWKKGDLGKFLDLVDAGVIPKETVLIIEQVNRLSRMKWMEQVDLWKEILSRGIVIRTCVPPGRYTRDNMNELAVGCPVVIYMMLAHLDSQQKSEWVRAAWGQKKKKAASADRVPHGRTCPEWLRPVCVPHPRDAERLVTVRYEVIEERRALLERIYRWALEMGWGAMRILRELNARHLPAWNGAAVRQAAEAGAAPRWELSWVKHLLRTRTVLGEYQRTARDDAGVAVPDGPPVAGYYPAAIPEGLFDAVQAAKRKRRRTGGRKGAHGLETNLFTGLAFEATSRLPFSVHNSRTSATRGRKAATHRSLATDPPTSRVPYARFEEVILDTVADLKPSDVDGRHQADALTLEADRLQDERVRLGFQLDKLDRQIRELPPEDWPDRVVARMAELQSLIREKDEEVRAAKERANTSGRTEALAEIQTCVQLLDEVKGTDREAGVRERIKARLPLLVESIWAVVQPVNRMCRVVHARLYLHGGTQRYVVFRCGNPKKVSPAVWRLDACDLRAPDVARHAVDAFAGGRLVAGPAAG
jgi:DNA invertase Pin-like site-specific DNA recombinase